MDATRQAQELLPEPTMVDSDSALADCCATCAKAGRIAFDTEFIRTDTFYPKLGLIQICDGDSVWLVDPLAIVDFAPLVDLLVNEQVVKVFHSCSEDLEVLQSAFGVLPTPLFDTQIAAAFAGEGFSRGYGRLVEQVLGIALDKHETRSDWLQRPLTPSQCLYAAEDVIYLVRVYDHLLAELNPERLAWIREDMADLLDSAATPADPDSYYLRIKGAWKLPPADQQLLQKLAAWREQLAREQNKPRSRIVPDNVLIEVARLHPTSRNQLSRIDGFHPQSARQYGELLLEQLDQCLAQGGDGSGLELVAPPLEREARLVLAEYRSLIDSKAQELGIAPELLARKKDLETLVRSRLDGKPVLTGALAQSWRRQVIGEELLAHGT